MKRILLLLTFALLSLGACTDDPKEDVDPSVPDVEITDDMLTRSRQLNLDLKTLFDLNQKPMTAEVAAVESKEDGYRITFSDRMSITVRVNSSISDAPLVGILANESKEVCWAVNHQGQSRILTDDSGKSCRIDEAYPVTSISDQGIWKVSLRKSKMAIRDNSGKELAATGEEPVSLFRSVEEADGQVKIRLYDGKYISFPKVNENQPDCSQTVSALNANMQHAASLLDFKGLVAKVEESDRNVEIYGEDGNSISVPTDHLTPVVPFVGFEMNGERLCWRLCGTSGQPWLTDAQNHPIPVGEKLPLMGVDADGYWTVSFENAASVIEHDRIVRGTSAPVRIKDADGSPIKATSQEQIYQIKDIAVSKRQVRIDFASDYKIELTRLFDVTAEMQQRIDEVNREITAYRNLYEKKDLLVVEVERISGEKLAIRFEDGSQVDIRLEKDAQMPMFGAREQSGDYFWAMMNLKGQPLVKNQDGQSWNVVDARPVLSVDKMGHWCIAPAEEAEAHAWELPGRNGRPFEITGVEEVALFKSYELKERELVLDLSDGTQMQWFLKPDISDKMELRVAEINASIEKMAELYAKREVMAVALTREDNNVTIDFTDGSAVTFVCAPEAGKPFVGLIQGDDEPIWALTASEGTPALLGADGTAVGISGDQPVFSIDRLGYWEMTIGESVLNVLDGEGQKIYVSGTEPTSLFRSAVADEDAEQIVLELTSGLKLAYALYVEKSIDLSADATANAYIVSAEGDYAFSATVRGNGQGAENTTGYDPDIVLTDGMSADWVWMDGENLISNVKLDAAKGRITFSASAQKGNALIALVDNGTIVWSWHIWMTDTPATMRYESGAEFMDRNLGAVGTTPGSTDAYGMYYQWGRKDPFYGGITTETSAEAFKLAKEGTIVNPAFDSIIWGMEKSFTDFAGAASHPMTFYNDKTTNSQDWLKKTKKGLWAAEKTMNDPCPPGYKVPEIEAWMGLDDNHNYIDGVSEWDGELYGMTYTYNGNTTWYPAQGSRNHAAGNLIGLGNTRSGNYWSSNTAAANARYFYFQKKISRPGGINPDLDKYRSLGYSVRCVKE